MSSHHNAVLLEKRRLTLEFDIIGIGHRDTSIPHAARHNRFLPSNPLPRSEASVANRRPETIDHVPALLQGLGIHAEAD